MKKVRVILASVACMAAAAGVYASKSATTALGTFFVPTFTKGSPTAVFCSVVTTIACNGTATRCTVNHDYGVDGFKLVGVSKTVRVNNVTVCTAVLKP